MHWSLRQGADEILAHPRFADAGRALAGDRFVARMMADTGVIIPRGFLPPGDFSPAIIMPF
jgi:hypothetical protein